MRSCFSPLNFINLVASMSVIVSCFVCQHFHKPFLFMSHDKHLIKAELEARVPALQQEGGVQGAL